MMRQVVFGIGLLVWTACTTLSGSGRGIDGSERIEMTGLEEMSLEYIETRWGKAESNIPKGDGRVVIYKNIRSEDENPVTRKVTVKNCDVRLDVGQDLLVKSWDYENCRVVSSEK